MPFPATKSADDITTVTVEGQLIVANRQDLKQVVQDALDGGARKLLLDFTPTAYIDSSGLGALVSINKKVREVGGSLRLARFPLRDLGDGSRGAGWLLGRRGWGSQSLPGATNPSGRPDSS
jgi:anti-anti-sigma factor